MASPREPDFDPDEVVAVYTTKDLGEAEIVANAVRSDGIRCELDGESQGGFVELVEIKLLVRTADADRARRLIEHRAAFHRTRPPADR